jgi:hypothetical protein
VSVSATQSWTLSIGSSKESTRLQWSTEQSGGFSGVSHSEALIAAGEMSPVPAAATVFFRGAGRPDGDGSEMVTLTMVAP